LNVCGKGCEAERSEAERSPNGRPEGATVVMFN